MLQYTLLFKSLDSVHLFSCIDLYNKLIIVFSKCVLHGYKVIVNTYIVILNKSNTFFYSSKNPRKKVSQV